MQRSVQDSGAVAAAAHPLESGRPLVIDGDKLVGHLQLFIEAILSYVKPHPSRIAQVLRWLLKGRVNAELKLAQTADLDGVRLPITPSLAEYADATSQLGRDVYLVMSHPAPLLARLLQQAPHAARLIEPAGAASAGAQASRAEALALQFPQGFDYAGRSGNDLDVWRQAGHAVLVDTPADVERRVGAVASVVATFHTPSPFIGLLKSLRLHQWVKNVIVFVPIILGGHLADVEAMVHTLIAFIALGLVASATYLINDVWDMADDRKHWSKRNRPIAAGSLPAVTAILAAPLIGLPALWLAAIASHATLAVVLVYLAVTLAYSFGLKRIPFVDGLVLATLFTVRLAIGAAAAQVPPSSWLFVFSMFLFASLSYAKRHTEIARVIERQYAAVNGRGYRTVDAPLVLTVGVASGIGAVMIMVLYIVEEAFLYSFYGSTQWLWGFPVLVFLFVMRIWLVSARGEMHDDPVAFAIKDRACLALLGLLVVCFAFAWLG
ncbi:MAG: UbiA family prenyltransferase [Hyphomicrobiaceae bacterium]